MATYAKAFKVPKPFKLAGYAEPSAVATSTNDIVWGVPCEVPEGGVRYKVFLWHAGTPLDQHEVLPLDVVGFRGTVSADGPYCRVTVFNYDLKTIETQILDTVRLRV